MAEEESLADVSDIVRILQQWDENHMKAAFDPVPTLERLVKILEIKIKSYLDIDPDLLEDVSSAKSMRNDSKQILLVLFKNERFMKKFIDEYVQISHRKRKCPGNHGVSRLAIAACRLLLNMLLFDCSEESSMYQVKGLINRIFSWVEKSPDLLQNCAAGILANAMRFQDVATKFHEKNEKILPLMLQKLHRLQKKATEKNPPIPTNSHSSALHDEDLNSTNDPKHVRTTKKKKYEHEASESPSTSYDSDREDEINYQTIATKPIMILRYLTSLAKDETFLDQIFEQNALELILKYLDMNESEDDQMSLGALRYLSSLFCHKKVIVKFLEMSGLEKFLDVPRLSEAATGVLKCLVHVASCEDLMETICVLPKQMIREMVAYALCVLEEGDTSGRRNAISFLGFLFPFKTMLDEFDTQNGLERLLHVVLNFPRVKRMVEITLDTYLYAKYIAVALKRYMETHLYQKVEQLKNLAMKNESCCRSSIPPNKACKLSSEDVQAKIEHLQKVMSDECVWPELKKFYSLAAMPLLFDIINFERLWCYIHPDYELSSAETMRNCLDIISICSAVPEVLFDPVDTRSMTKVPVDLLLRTAGGIGNPDVRKAALRALANCVCAPIYPSKEYTASDIVEKANLNRRKSIENVWNIVRWNDGIMTLLKLLNVEEPIADAEGIRALACQAFVGLAKSEEVRQIMSQLPIFTDGRFRVLLEKPIHHEKQKEYAIFREYALKLMEQASDEITDTVAKYRIFNIAAQTRRKPSADMNMAVRIVGRPWGMNRNRNLDRKHIYSHFYPVKTFRSTANVETITCCIYSPCQQYLMTGTYSGKLMMLNAHSGICAIKNQCHESFIYNMESNRRGNLLLTSAGQLDEFDTTAPILWNTEPFFNNQLSIQNIFSMHSMYYAEFSKHEDKIIGTDDAHAQIFDVTTGETLLTFADDRLATKYQKNVKPTFSMNDDIVLSVGILWDVRSGKMIHKFDTLNAKLNGVFHPNGTDIIYNTGIWDLRTHHLLKIVPILDAMDPQFSPVDHVIYTSRSTNCNSPDNWTSFGTLDASTYDSIGSYDVRRDIYSLACNKFDSQIAVVENLGQFGDFDDSRVRIYDVGRHREDDDPNDNDNGDDYEFYYEDIDEN